MERKPLGAQIKLARKQAGMTADKLAEVCNMFIILCRNLQVSPATLLADYLPAPVYEERDRLHELYRTLTQEQRDLAVRLLDSMRESLTSGEQEEV